MCLRWNNRPLVKYTDISIAGPLDLSTYPVIRALEISLGKKKKVIDIFCLISLLCLFYK